eukprot:20043-Heterococcus_DN1.PRE.3
MTDGFGPVPPSLSGRRYAQLLVNVHTRHAWVYFVHHKSDALSVIESFLLYVVKARGKRMLLLRADNAKEFKSAALAKLLANFGSRQQSSAPYTPQQKGMVERYWRTAAESARAMLIESRLGDEYWCLAFRHVVYIRNRLHAAALPRGVTPDFRLNSQHANIKFMRVWGSPIYVYTERRFRDSKFSSNAKAGLLVGYDEASHCSLVYMPDERKIVSSIHVHVDESSVLARTAVTLTPGATTAITAPSNTIVPLAATATLPTTNSTTLPATSITTPVSPNTTSSTTETVATTDTPNSTGNTTITAADTKTLTSPSSTTNRVTAADTIIPVSPSNTNNTTVTAADTTTPASLSTTGNTKATNANTIAPTSTYATRSTVATSDDNTSILSGTTATSPVNNNTNSDSAHTTAAAGVKARRVRTSTKHFDEQYHYYETMIDEEIGLVAALVQADLLHYCTVGAKQAAIDECFASLDAAAASDNPTHKAAMNGPDAARWLAAIDAEIKAQIDNGTWDLVSLPIGAHAIGSKFVLRVKYKADGSLDKLKARLVAQGFTQVEGKDYFEHEVFAPTVRFSSLRVLFVLIIQHGWFATQFDVDTAFLHAPLHETIYIRLPAQYTQYDDRGTPLVCSLKKTIYGLKQSARELYKLMHNWFINHGFTQNSADPCIYCRISDTGTIIVALYADDCLMVGTVQFEMNGLENEFNNDFSIKRLGEPTYLLGMEIDINRTAGTLTIKHTKYVTYTLARFGMTDVKAVNTPAVEAHTNSVRTATTAADKAFMADKPYGAAVGCLQYLATASRPDRTNAARIQGKYVADPTEEDWKAVKRIMRYLQGTKQLGLVFHAESSVPRALRAYSDADWAGDTETRRSTTAYILTLSGCVISWQSRQQKSVALSTTEAEYMAACAASQEVVYMRRLLAGIGMPQTEPTIIFEDNQGCIGLANNPILHARTKHIDIRYHFINEQIAAGAIVLKYISTRAVNRHAYAGFGY